MEKHKIAFSFAGENRSFVESIATALKKNGYDIFYDKFFMVELWGSDLTITLPKHYNNSHFVVMFIDELYLQKMWTYFERQIIIENYLKLKGSNYVLPVYLDDFEGNVPGLSGLIGFIRCRTENPEYLIKLLLEKLQIVFRI